MDWLKGTIYYGHLNLFNRIPVFVTDPLTNTPEDDLAKLRRLRERFGESPLVELVRKLIVKVDDPERGPEAHRILVLISGDREVFPKSSAWMDWLDGVPHPELSWEKLMPAPKRILVDSEPIPSRPSVEASTGPMILSRKQQLWQKAMQRHKAGKKGSSWRPLFYLAVAALAIFFAYRTREAWGPDISLLFSRAGAAKAQKSPSFTPVLVWGQYDDSVLEGSAWEGPLPSSPVNRAFLAIVSQDGLGETFRQWLTDSIEKSDIPDDWGRKACWVNLWQYESIFLEKTRIRGEFFDFSDALPLDRTWRWKRSSGSGESLEEGSCEEKSRIEDANAGAALLHLTVIRQNDGQDDAGSGSAHYMVLDSCGLKLWQWKLKIGKHLFKGKVSRENNRKTLTITMEGFEDGPQRSKVEVDPAVVIMPPVWSPMLAEEARGMVLLPFRGSLAPAAPFFRRIGMAKKKLSFAFSSQSGAWEEKWLGEDKAPEK